MIRETYTKEQLDDFPTSEELGNTQSFSNYRVKQIIKSYENALFDKKSEICGLRETIKSNMSLIVDFQNAVMSDREEIKNLKDTLSEFDWMMG